MTSLHICVTFTLLLYILNGAQGLNSVLIGERCDVDKQCLTRQMTCESGVCNCIDRHYPSEDKRNCIATAGSSCYETSDCFGLLNSECHESEKMCVCSTGYHPSEDNQECLPETRYQGACKSSVQCTKYLGDFGVCQGELCSCKSNYHYSTTDQKCLETKYLDDACVNATQCLTKDLKENQATCTDGRCVCRQGGNVDGLCKDGAERLMISWVCLLALCIFKFLV